jgi:hypothetical protein
MNVIVMMIPITLSMPTGIAIPTHAILWEFVVSMGSAIPNVYPSVLMQGGLIMPEICATSVMIVLLIHVLMFRVLVAWPGRTRKVMVAATTIVV